MTDHNYLTTNKWNLIRALLSPNEYRLFAESLITYQYTLEAMAKTGKYDDWVPESLEHVKVLQELFRDKESE